MPHGTPQFRRIGQFQVELASIRGDFQRSGINFEVLLLNYQMIVRNCVDFGAAGYGCHF